MRARRGAELGRPVCVALVGARRVGYFKTGNAAAKFNQLDSYVYERLRALRIKRAGSKLRAGQAEQWTRDYFVKGLGLHRLRGTVCYPEAA